ncbi:hydrolase 1, exosortase A system-associated [Aurantiacibacter sp. D1-12]|uniref:hydrolase 1, exosortase A system-associated n=1 Tax=Aurantiacibacter sp. D1-12 TaxID=2993658 RepID=UPI00237D013D|nr:hydrolase 1, exosortase A system-associated [Aurantiacibacter sp. D1-12]MDE1466571.1 hydrolase 1, exosortase A system-associated [Aurantiacibacter sp. D1-12]
MSRRHVTFACEGVQLVGSIDSADGTTGLLIVSGGNELRAGTFAGQATLAQRIASEGFPAFRFDRRGTGDSEGENGSFRSSGPDLAAAIGAFKAECPQLERIVAFGNCDAASALVLNEGAGCDSLVLSNPWTFDDNSDDDLPSGDAIRSRYADKLRNPKELKRLLTGKVNLSGILKGVLKSMGGEETPSSLAGEMAEAIAKLGMPFTVLIAGNDRTGLAFAKDWNGPKEGLLTCKGASHAYAEPHAQEWLAERILAALRV